jgi:hypothetical protein
MAEKLVLVPERQLKRTQQETQSVSHPVTRQVLDLDREIEELLRRDLPADEKLKRYSVILERYLEYQKQLRLEGQQPVTVRVEEKESTSPSQSRDAKTLEQAVEAAASTSPEVSYQSITRALPKPYRSKGDRLLQYMQNNSDINWNSQGQLLQSGRVVPDTNIVDLVYDAVSPHPSREKALPGIEVFHRLLQDSNVPATLLSKSTLSRIKSTAAEPPSPPSTPQTKRQKLKRNPVRQPKPVTFKDWH